MANQFLVEIHAHISRQIEQSRRAREKFQVGENDQQRAFYEGQLHELKAMRAFLTESYDLSTQQYY